MEQISKHSFQNGNVRRLLFNKTLPMILGISSMIGFNLVDTFFVSKLGTAALAAIGFTFPVVLLISSFTLGLGAGASAVISRAVGQDDLNQAKRLATDSIILALLFTVLFIVAGVYGFEAIFKSLGAKEEILPLIKEYMFVWYWGMICVVVPMVGNNIIRATGDTKTPGFLMVIAIAMNLILDPILIFGWGIFPAMGLAGAALATVISRAITFFIVLWVLISKYRLLELKLPALVELIDSWKKVMYIGLPNAVTNIAIPFGVGVLTQMMSQFGPEAVAAFGVTAKLKAFAFIVIYSLSTVLGPFVGQNWGAKKVCRAYLGVKDSQFFALLWGAFIAVVFWLMAYPFARVFSSSDKVIETIVLYLRIVPIGYGLHGLLTISNTALTVLHRPYHALVFNALYMFIFCIPFAYFGARYWGVLGIFTGAVLAKLISGSLAYYWIKYIFAAEEKQCELEYETI